ncbi:MULTISPECIES: small ribosomal subunit biogenesis GTPase RsgA [unclassified Synechocystis]|uniref:small ribosomal subunit biogenesis GTPase RsgA n=1 Tax=unclassified Synechocystis TaxID=2640012 RepID=UPI000429DF87|nr:MULTISPECIES: small ribosomal subunit biogenesis GTPase RsgA [unclassified Synechocystis]AIE75305.1 Ribosome small subunit-stimulated GTPase EngC [Synechocystis sp. PCC 6714]MCT0253042.1 small ribosomal subunit biogenesis GTPase RsgA [Synechocystis sp. CS-94]
MAKVTDDGTVIAIQANYYWVRLQNVTSEPLLCTRRTRLKKVGQKVMVGDQVRVELPPSLQLFIDGNDNGTKNRKVPLAAEGDLGAIAKVYPRRTVLERPPVANAEQICLVFSLADPPLEEWQLSRFLVQAEATGLEISLCLNKQDLVDETEVDHWGHRLGAWGYTPILLSVQNRWGLEKLQRKLTRRISLMAGPSGVGKSSLINLLVPGVEQQVKKVSGKLRKGRHTTRHVELFDLPDGGLLADTPGFNQPDLAVEPSQLINLFPEGRQRLQGRECFFKDCLHRGEPDCAVGQNWERYEHYLTFLEEVLARQSLEQQRETDTGLKTKTGSDGQEYDEPKLETKKYRRHSRRQEHQELQSYCEQTDLNSLQGNWDWE